jgi:hypothetical protein
MDHAEKIKFRIVEYSSLARLAALILRAEEVAIVVGATIYLSRTKKKEFLENAAWLRHELMHVEQYRRQGTLLFIVKYLWESLRNGYRNNCYETEARQVENLVDFEKKFKAVSR